MRIIILAGVLLLVLVGLWARAYYIQVVQGFELSSFSHEQYWTQESVRGNRGDIYAQDTLLAKSVVVSSVFVRPGEIEDPEPAARELSSILEKDFRDVFRRIQTDSNFVWIERKIGDRAAARIRARELDGVYLTDEPQRIYPQGRLAGHLLGFVGMDNRGMEGLELEFDSRLSGERDRLLVQRDALGRVLYAPGELSEELSGEDVVLTLDTRVQHAAEEVIKEAVLEHDGEIGMAMVVDVEDGSILASAQFPFFDPNNFHNYSPGAWRHRAALDPFEPGSTTKSFLLATALEEDVLSPETKYHCESGRWQVEGGVIRDTREYDKLPAKKILRYSSNIGAAKIGLDLGVESYYNYLRGLGLNRETGLPFPAENEGILRKPNRWKRFDLVTASFGQGFSWNFYQMAQAYLCLARKGDCQPLRITQEPEVTPQGDFERVFSERTGEQVLRILRNVVEEDGTGTRARMAGVEVGGKTGTAQKVSRLEGGYKDEYIASFVGLVPAMEPEYLLLAVVDSPQENHYGGVVAAPAVREIGGTLLTQRRDLRKVEHLSLTAMGTGESNPEKAEQMPSLQNADLTQQVSGSGVPDLRGLPLRRAMEILAEQGVVPKLEGSGTRVKEQSPEPGREWKEQKVILHLAAPGEVEGDLE